MYVCLCKAVTDNDIREAVREGAGRLRELRRRLGVASDCGCCAREALQLLRDGEAPSQACEDRPQRPLPGVLGTAEFRLETG